MQACRECEQPRSVITVSMYAGKRAAAALQEYKSLDLPTSGSGAKFTWSILEPAARQISHEASLILTVLATTDRRCSPAEVAQAVQKAGVDIRLDCAVSCCKHMSKRGRRCCGVELLRVPAPGKTSGPPDQAGEAKHPWSSPQRG